MNGTQIVEKEKKEKAEKVNLECSPVEVLSFQEIVDGFVEKCSNKGAQNDLRKTIVKYSLGFLKESIFNNTMRVRSFPRAEVVALKEQLNTACVTSIMECVLDMLMFNTSKDEAVKASLADADDLEWTLSVVDLKSLDPKQSIYDLPADIDPYVLRLRIPESKKIETQSRLGQLIEDFLVIHNSPSTTMQLRKLFAQYTMGQILESKIAINTYIHEVPYRKVIGYINKNYKAVQQALESGKGEKTFKDDSDYITAVMKA